MLSAHNNDNQQQQQAQNIHAKLLEQHGVSTMPPALRSKLKIYREYDGECDYCTPPAPKGRVAFNVKIDRLLVSDYQYLIDHGWRRSGYWLYLPSNEKSCCPNYTIRLDVKRFVASKSQKRTMQRWQKYLAGKKVSNHRASKPDGESKPIARQSSTKVMFSSAMLSELEATLQQATLDALIALKVLTPPVSEPHSSFSNTISSSNNSNNSEMSAGLEGCSSGAPLNQQQQQHNTTISSSSSNNNVGNTTTSAHSLMSFPAARVSEILHKRKNKQIRDNMTSNICLQLKPFLPASLPVMKVAHDIAARLPSEWHCHVAAPGFLNFRAPLSSTRPPLVRSDSRMLMDSPGKRTPRSRSHSRSRSSTRPPRAHHFEMVMERASFSEEKYQLYKKYQQIVHKEDEFDVQRSLFTDHLCSSPLIFEEKKSENDPSCGYGSFHQAFRVDGRLVAVSVVDVLPSSLSSVYFFYDPTYSWLSLGVISALLEIQWVHQFAMSSPRSPLHYYYMGYYIHRCKKMNYKAGYQPSDLLCPKTHQWVSVSECVPILDQHKFAAFAKNCPDFPGHIPDELLQVALSSASLSVCNTVCRLADLAPSSRVLAANILTPFIRRVGPAFARNIVFQLD